MCEGGTYVLTLRKDGAILLETALLRLSRSKLQSGEPPHVAATCQGTEGMPGVHGQQETALLPQASCTRESGGASSIPHTARN